MPELAERGDIQVPTVQEDIQDLGAARAAQEVEESQEGGEDLP